MRDRLAHFGSYSGNTSELLPHLIHHLRVRPITFFGNDFDLARVYSHRVFVELRSTSAPCSRDYFRNFVYRCFDDLSNAI